MNAAFVARIEDVLAVYERPYDPQFPVVCFDAPGHGLGGAAGPAQGRIRAVTTKGPAAVLTRRFTRSLDVMPPTTLAALARRSRAIQQKVSA